MGFLAPALLALGALAGVPLLVHLLRRRVGRIVDFPAVRYLARMEQEHSRDLKLKHRLLLILRMLAVLALALAAARPIARLAGVGHAPVALAIVLDNSMSSGSVVSGRSLLDGLKADAITLVGSLSPDDRVWLVTADGRLTGGTPDAVRAAIEQTLALGGRGDLAAAVRRASTLARGDRDRESVIALASDGQANTFGLASDSAIAMDDTPLVALVRPHAPIRNHAVLSVKTEPARWTPSGGLSFAVAGDQSAPWRVNLEGRTVARGVGQAAPVTDPTRVAQRLASSATGWVRGSVELDADELRGDDVRFFAVRVAPPASVAVRSEAGDFVTTAVSTLVEEGRLNRGAAGADVITIAGADAAGVRGPVLLTAPLDPLRIGDANRTLARLGIPWRFGAIARDAVIARAARARRGAAGGDDVNEGARTPSGASDAVPELRGATQLRAAQALAGVAVQLRYPLVYSPGASGRDTAVSAPDTLALAGGSAWAVAGPGYVLIASPLDPEATELPLRAAFVPWVLDALSRRLGDEGEIIDAVPGERLDDLSATELERPDGSVLALPGRSLVVPNEPGVYYTRRGGARVGAIVVNAEPEESDLRTIDGDSANARPAMLRRVSGRSVTSTVDADRWREAIFDQASGRSLLIPLAIVALVALLLESWFARERASAASASHTSGVRQSRAA